MRTRNLVVGAAVLAVAAGGGWYAYAAMFGSPVKAGAGPYQTQLVECQERLFEDEMHPADMKFLDATVWREGTPENLKLGGKLSRMNYGNGRTTTYNYSCTIHSGRIFDAGIQ